jgi:hypothetical protein
VCGAEVARKHALHGTRTTRLLLLLLLLLLRLPRQALAAPAFSRRRSPAAWRRSSASI